MTPVRVRQHVNPLCHKYQKPLITPDWHCIYPNLDRPLHLDIGCARGRFLLEMAQIQPQINFLGVEIREPLVTEANSIRDRLNLTNLHYLFANINNSLPTLLESLPLKTLHYITIQFPDPWFKQRQAKRRVVQPELVNILAEYLPDGAIVFLQSDIESIAREMRDRFERHPSFQRQHEESWLANNPLPVATEREIATLAQNKPVYRALFQQKRPSYF
jgi:tRNA (guanine-N7-)-methyltransferase